MKLKDIVEYVTDKISSDAIDLDSYVTTDSILHNKSGREIAQNLPPQVCTLTRFRKGDILVGNIRPYLKKIWKADIDGGCNADVLVFRAKSGHTSEFVYAVLLQDAFFDYVMKGAKGSKMPRGEKNQILSFEIPNLTSDEERIGKFITDLHNKITILKAINRNLEAMARQLYDYWFVQFDFPDENGKPYKSSGGKMVWNEKLKREIPEGWVYMSLGEIAPIITGKEDANFADQNGIYPFFTCSSSILKCQVPVFSGSAILLSGNGDIHAKYYKGKFNAYQRTYVLIPKDDKYFALLYFVCSGEIERLLQGTNGSIIKFITKPMIDRILVPVSGTDSLYDYLNRLLVKKLSNDKEIETLMRERDELLPLLMNGQVSVTPQGVNCDLSLD